MMAGRPRRQLATLDEFEKIATRLFLDLFKASPSTYKEHPLSESCRDWRRCVEASLQSALSLGHLADEIRRKAGIPPPREEDQRHRLDRTGYRMDLEQDEASVVGAGEVE